MHPFIPFVLTSLLSVQSVSASPICSGQTCSLIPPPFVNTSLHDPSSVSQTLHISLLQDSPSQKNEDTSTLNTLHHHVHRLLHKFHKISTLRHVLTHSDRQKHEALSHFSKFISYIPHFLHAFIRVSSHRKVFYAPSMSLSKSVYQHAKPQVPVEDDEEIEHGSCQLPLPNSHVGLSLFPKPSTVSHLSISDISATTFSDTSGPHDDFFGPLRAMEAEPSELEAYVHPRVLMGRSEYQRLLERYADTRFFNISETWSNYFKDLSLHLGPNLPILVALAEMETNGSTEVYTSRPYEPTTEFKEYRLSLQPLVNTVSSIKAVDTDGFAVCALWAGVADEQQAQGIERFLPSNTTERCINAVVAWAKIMLAHRSFYCNTSCPSKRDNMENRAYVWNTTSRWSIDIDWYTGGAGMALAYDLLYESMTDSQRIPVRSALAAIVLNRFSWGTSYESTPSSPNVEKDPHRSFTNWCGYHGNIYLTNLAIEGETGFDNYTSAILEENNSQGFNQTLHNRYSQLLEQFMLHSFYPDGATFEDGYTYFTALREGSLALLASHRRKSNVLGTIRFKNAIHNAVQMTEPWHCGNLIGHASGGGSFYNAYAGLFRYAYPSGELPGMLWRLRYGNYQRNSPCRIAWAQSMLQLAFLGGEHSSDADSPQMLPDGLRERFSKAYYSPRRGLLIMRASLSELSTYMHFDARPDAFIVGHDNADRGVVTFSALRFTWIIDLPWARNLDSRRHSLMHVDGLAQVLKTPSVKMLKVVDDGDVTIASADLTYAYNVQWSPGSRRDAPKISNIVYLENGTASTETVSFEREEDLDPWTLGWPVDDRGEDLGFRDSMVLFGEDGIGFSGLYTWKRQYRARNLSHIVRSTGVVRSNDVGFGFVVDSVDAGPGSHVFESYFILDAQVTIAGSSCTTNRCVVTLEVANIGRLDAHAVSLGTQVSYRVETFGSNDASSRIIFRSEREQNEEMWIVLYPHTATSSSVDVQRAADGTVRITTTDGEHVFHISATDHSIVRGAAPQPATQPQTPTGPPATTPPSTPAAFQATTPLSTTSSPARTPPVTPLRLPFGKRQRIRARHSTGNKAAFFLENGYARQAVVNFSSSSHPMLQQSDLMTTCFPESRTEAKLTIFDCGAASEAFENYQMRNCNAVVESTAGDTCSTQQFGTRVAASLQTSKIYYLVISLRSASRRRALVFLEHLVTGSDSKGVRRGLPTPSTSPSGFGARPMRAIGLSGSATISGSELSSMRSTFMHDTDGKYQIVFSVRGRSDVGRNVEDLLTTCAGGTTVRTEIRMFDCGDDAAYEERRCGEVYYSRRGILCGGYRSRVGVVLEGGREYFVVVSMWEVERGLTPLLTIRHGRRAVRGGR